jgi:putative hydrolase of the HAD superfamily
MELKAVIFDLGETLFTYGDVNVDAMFSRGAKLTYDYLKECTCGTDKLPSFPSYHRSHIVSIKLHYFWTNIVSREFNCMALLDKKLQRLDIQLGRAQLEQLCWLWYQPLGEVATVEPDLAETLGRLQQMGLQLAILSNTFLPGVVLDRHLDQYDLLPFFPIRIYSSDTVYRKPDRRIYQRALNQLGLEPAAALMVGDKMREDIKGSQRAGLRAVFKRGVVNRSRRTWDHVPVIKTIAELPDLLRKLKIKNQK